MKSGPTVLIRAAAIMIVSVAAWIWVGLQHIDDAVAPPLSALILEAFVPFAILCLSQLGLFLAPGAWRRGLRYRLLVGLLMVPSTLFLLSTAVEHVREVAVYGPRWLFSIYGLWMPILALYVWQYAFLFVRPRNRVASSAAQSA